MVRIHNLFISSPAGSQIVVLKYKIKSSNIVCVTLKWHIHFHSTLLCIGYMSHFNGTLDILGLPPLIYIVIPKEQLKTYWKSCFCWPTAIFTVVSARSVLHGIVHCDIAVNLLMSESKTLLFSPVINMPHMCIVAGLHPNNVYRSDYYSGTYQ